MPKLAVCLEENKFWNQANRIQIPEPPHAGSWVGCLTTLNFRLVGNVGMNEREKHKALGGLGTGPLCKAWFPLSSLLHCAVCSTVRLKKPVPAV